MLLSTPRDVVRLRGDTHHEYILEFSDGAWLAIDRKSPEGNADGNCFSNPDHPCCKVVSHLAHQLAVVADTAHPELERLLEWILARTAFRQMAHRGWADRAAAEIDRCRRSEDGLARTNGSIHFASHANDPAFAARLPMYDPSCSDLPECMLIATAAFRLIFGG